MNGPHVLLALGTAAGVVLPSGIGPMGAIPVAQTSSQDAVSSMDTLLTGHTDNLDLFADLPVAQVEGFQLPVPEAFGSASSDTLSDTGFISNVTDFGLFTTTTAANPDENFIAFVLQIPALGVTDILTSGADPADNLGLGELGIGLAGSTVNTLLTPIFDTTLTLPFEDPFADLFTLLVQLGF